MRYLKFFILTTLFSGVLFLDAASSPVPSLQLCSLYDDYQYIVAEHERRKQEKEKEKQEQEKKARKEEEQIQIHLDQGTIEN